jgi:hypothetical protein
MKTALWSAFFVFFAIAGFVQRDGPTEAAPAAPQTHAGTAAPADDAITADVSRFALNALLVPLLDDAEPPRWTDAALGFLCGPATQVEVDGKPIVPGVGIPATSFTVRWDMDGCSPLGPSSVELSGIVELLVFHEDTGLSAVVSANRMRISSATGARHLEAPFGASMSFAAAGDRL